MQIWPMKSRGASPRDHGHPGDAEYIEGNDLHGQPNKNWRDQSW